MAAHLGLMGFPTTLYNRTPDHIAAIKELGRIDLDSSGGGPRGFGNLMCVTSNIAEALEQARMIMVGGAFIGACQYRLGLRAAFKRVGRSLSCTREHLRGDRVRQSVARSGLSGRCHCG